MGQVFVRIIEAIAVAKHVFSIFLKDFLSLLLFRCSGNWLEHVFLVLVGFVEMPSSLKASLHDYSVLMSHGILFPVFFFQFQNNVLVFHWWTSADYQSISKEDIQPVRRLSCLRRVNVTGISDSLFSSTKLKKWFIQNFVCFSINYRYILIVVGPVDLANIVHRGLHENTSQIVYFISFKLQLRATRTSV